MSFSWGEITQWRSGPLEAAVRGLSDRRSTLLDCQDELDTMAAPGTWTGDAAQAATGTRRALSEDLETLVAQVSAARRALSDAADAFPGLERAIEDARSFAGDQGLSIGADGSVEDVRGTDGEVGFAAREALAERNRLVGTCADLVAQALDRAESIDRDLALVFGSIRDDEVEVDADSLALASMGGHLLGAGGLGPPPEGGTPRQNAAWWDRLTELQQEYVLEHHPDMVGNLDGVPFGVRDEANRQLVEQRREELEGQMEELQRDLEAAERSGSPGQVYTGSESRRVEREIEALQAQIEELEAIEAQAGLPDHHVLGVDFGNVRAEAIIAQGDLDTASHVATFTPGLTSTVHSMAGYGGELADIRAQSALALVDQMSAEEIQAAGGPEAAARKALADVAVVTWMGYQAPQTSVDSVLSGGSVALEGAAEAGGTALADFHRGIDAVRGGGVDLTALGHSYGSTTLGNALQQEGTGVDRAGFFGSPGLGVTDLGDLHLPEGGAYYAEAKWDGVGDLGRFGTDPSYLEGVNHMSTGPQVGPTGPLEEVTGHTDYLVDGSTSAYNLAQLITRPDGIIEGRDFGPLDHLRIPII